ncbi:hypothetical protein K402DRAFT_413323 [Aulographum hederae CBS 113979]|uniref:Uncharacterized protein n=1 Tax=Aulographum hederae CBS 113979 TaxID=1176131 RepID=A0A6G1GX10_9PEZI|nr:hypothetical protein K402DRAFT_413323 [Aulographum hederae CBS 113979]
MAAQTNGRLKKPQSEPNGHVVSSVDARRPTTTSRKSKPKRSLVGASASMAARALFWYSLFTAVFRCPSTLSELNDASPKLCQPYLTAKSHASPYFTPYYNTYVASYVEQARPHAEKFSDQVYTPAANFASKNYETYAAPQISKAQQYTEKEWARTAQPQVDAAQIKAKALYDVHLARYLNQAWSSLGPYFFKIQPSIVDAYQTHLRPAYESALPYGRQVYGYGQQGYLYGHHATVNVIFPYVRSAQRSTQTFLNRSVLPWIKIIYGENVEPQLMKISERLGRYKDGKKLEAAAESIDHAPIESSASSDASSLSSSIATSTSETSSSASTTSSTSATNSVGSDAEVREKIASDLKNWQEKFAVAADKGAEDLKERVKDITHHQADSQAKAVGQSLVVRLEETVHSRIASVKKDINKTVRGLTESADSAEIESANDKVIASIRSAGIAIKDRAQAVRTWKEKYDHETVSLVKAASDSTLDVIDNIRDLGLQEIGMRWAWMEGVTYKDWSKYHALKKTFDEWRDEVEAVAMQHEGLTAAKQKGEQVEEKAMSVAQDAAKELGRLKDVAKWKLHAQDSTDDFSSKALPAGAVKGARQVIADIKDAVSPGTNPSQPGSMDSIIASASESATDISSKASEALVREQTGAFENAASQVSDRALGSKTPAVERASSSMASAADAASGAAENALTQASESHNSVASDISAAMGSAASGAQSVVSAPKFKKDQVSENINGTPAPPPESVLSDASGKFKSVSSKASEAIPHEEVKTAAKKVWGGAQAQFVDAKQVILDDIADDDDDDDDATYSEKIQHMADQAGDQVEVLTSAIMDAIRRPTSTQGTLASVTSLASEEFERAMSAASEVLYGTKQGTVESISSAASDRYAAAVAAASQAIYGTTPAGVAGMFSAPTQGALESMSSVASSKLSEGLSAASAQYTSAKVAVGAQPPPAHQQYLAEAQRRYYEGIGVAHARYSEFLDAASTAVYGTPTLAYQSVIGTASSAIVGTPQPAYESILSVAKSKYSDTVSEASVHLEAIKEMATSLVSMTGTKGQTVPTSLMESASSSWESIMSEASASLAGASSKASAAIYGTSTGKLESAASAVSENIEHAALLASSSVLGSETPWAESVASQASQNWESLVSKASEQVYGQPTPWHESVWSEAGGYGAQATEAAASQYSAVQALISDLVIGKEPDFTESVMSRFQSAYSTGYPAMASSASSYASEAYASAASVVQSVFTPPPTIEAILESASDQLDAAVSAASLQFYGSEKGTVEQATEAAGSMYSSAAAKASEAVYGTPAGYAEQAQNSFDSALSSAQNAISVAIYGTPTGTVEAAGSTAASVCSSVSSVAGEQLGKAGDAIGESYDAAASMVSSVIYGPEQGAVDSASSRLAAAVESAKAKMAQFAEDAGERASEGYEKAKKTVGEVVDRVRDEL